MDNTEILEKKMETTTYGVEGLGMGFGFEGVYL